jgi:hypothetical protein
MEEKEEEEENDDNQEEKEDEMEGKRQKIKKKVEKETNQRASGEWSAVEKGNYPLLFPLLTTLLLSHCPVVSHFLI